MKISPWLCSFMISLMVQPLCAQTNTDLTLGTWEPGDFGLTLDRPLYQSQAHLKNGAPGDKTRNAQIFWWDSTGRFRFSKTNPDAPTIGYRYLTIAFDTNSPLLPDTLDEVSLAMGFHLGDLAGGNLGVVLGAGYSGDNPFADTNGIFGIGHLTWQRAIDEKTALELTLDYNGMNALLPDVPLPGFEYVHQGDPISFTFGFPNSSFEWKIIPQLKLDARYSAPYTADVSLEYRFNRSLSVFTDYSNFLNGFELDGEPTTNRFFYQMRRVEAGVRYINPNFVVRGAYVDVALTVGYAFDQEFSRGFDVRDLDNFAAISDVPYVGIILRSRF